MKKKFVTIFCIFMYITSLFAAERNIPIDMFLMIDKSLSMAENKCFASLHKWVRNELIEQMLIPGDWITIYQFYEQPEHLLTLSIKQESDKNNIINVINEIEANGHYTDIGLALDKINESLQARGTNGRLKVLLLVTDLKHDAPWTSRYAGKTKSFESPYLAEARKILHDGWFEITLDMDIQDQVVKTTSELYSTISKNNQRGRTELSGVNPLDTINNEPKNSNDPTIHENQVSVPENSASTTEISKKNEQTEDIENTEKGLISSNLSDTTNSDISATSNLDKNKFEQENTSAQNTQTSNNPIKNTEKQTTIQFGNYIWLLLALVLLVLFIFIIRLTLVKNAEKKAQKQQQTTKTRR